MLIVKKPSLSSGDIISFKLVSGEEIVGRLTKFGDDAYWVDRPVGVMVQMVGPQQAQISFAPFMTSVEDDAAIQFNISVMLTQPSKTRPDVAANYRRATTGIEVPQQGLIL